VKSGFATLIGMVIAIAILAFVMIKVLSAQLENRKRAQTNLNPQKVQQQVDDLQNQLQQKQNEDINQEVK